MEQGNPGSFKKYMHPLEESVLSLATGRIENPVPEPPKDNVIPMTPRIEELRRLRRQSLQRRLISCNRYPR